MYLQDLNFTITIYRAMINLIYRLPLKIIFNDFYHLFISI